MPSQSNIDFTALPDKAKSMLHYLEHQLESNEGFYFDANDYVDFIDILRQITNTKSPQMYNEQWEPINVWPCCNTERLVHPDSESCEPCRDAESEHKYDCENQVNE